MLKKYLRLLITFKYFSTVYCVVYKKNNQFFFLVNNHDQILNTNFWLNLYYMPSKNKNELKYLAL